MPMQHVEYEFPDPEKDEKLQEVEVKEEEAVDTTIEVEGAVGRETIGKPDKKEDTKDNKVEIEVEDDTPAADRGRTPSEPPEEVTNAELENYSDKVKKRIQHFSKGYHDERRAKEQAVREREEAIERICIWVGLLAVLGLIVFMCVVAWNVAQAEQALLMAGRH